MESTGRPQRGQISALVETSLPQSGQGTGAWGSLRGKVGRRFADAILPRRRPPSREFLPSSSTPALLAVLGKGTGRAGRSVQVEQAVQHPAAPEVEARGLAVLQDV